jgi:hypothetical protein
MSHLFSIKSAQYDSTKGATDPRINVVGSMDNYEYVFDVGWQQIQAANIVGDQDAVRSVLAPLMLNTFIVYRLLPVFDQQQPIPRYQAANLPSPVWDRNGGWVSVPEALVGSWTAS